MFRELYAERNREIVRGVQLDIYLSHSGGGSALSSVMKTLYEGLKPLLFLKPRAIEYTVFGRSLAEGSRHALQTFIAAPSGKRGHDPRDVKARVRSLVKELAKRDGANGTLALRSIKEGRVKQLGWCPNGISQHRGDETALEIEETKGFPDIYELVTLWRSEDERDAAKVTAYTYGLYVNRLLGRPQGRIKEMWA